MATESDRRLTLDLQYACARADLPDRTAFETWALAALGDGQAHVELVIRLVDEAESRALNARYRGYDKPTNVLSFPFEPPPGVALDHLGDLVICAAVVAREAAQQHKTSTHHWAHMVVHGILHLRGYDHQSGEQASVMERLETQILQGFAIADPYTIADVAV